ncbi:hypothetical protein Q5P01_010552 [Channa striata]|uniref:Uncharacterized protein n=1 Tax=Channa striata TaxID=64152 RepID=A0AA88SQN9_CHASR|nr:hypothetical protein Q5P01_010552 [Channa striata]
MYPSIMCALNIFPETTVPWPPSRFGHDLTGWVCYSWEAEGFEYASLILRYDRDRLDKFKQMGSQLPEFLACVHQTLVEDTLKRMYVIERGNVPVQVIRDPEEGYLSDTLSDVTRPFMKDRRVKLEYENSSSTYCHVAKKSYVSHSRPGR